MYPIPSCVDCVPVPNTSHQNDQARPSEAQAIETSQLNKCCICMKVLPTAKGLKLHTIYCKRKETIRSNCEDDIDNETLVEKLVTYKKNLPILKRIPKGARPLVASKLANIIELCVSQNDYSAWEKLFTFVYKSLYVPKKGSKSLTTLVKEHVEADNLPEVKTYTKMRKKRAYYVIQKVESKISEFDTKGALRLLSSNEELAPVNEENVQKLKALHPPSYQPITFNHNDEVFPDTEVSIPLLLKCLQSFKNGSSSGIDGLSPQHLKDLTSKSAGDAGTKLLEQIRKFTEFIVNESVLDEIRPCFFGATLCALNKKHGGLRPIAVGCCLRRLAAKVACMLVQENCAAYFQPHKFGFHAKLGCESVVHAVGKFIHEPKNTNCVILKIDYRNAFNKIEGDSMFREVYNIAPEIYQFMRHSYATSSFLFFGDEVISSQRGL